MTCRFDPFYVKANASLSRILLFAAMTNQQADRLDDLLIALQEDDDE